jgi:ABC-2 type transport system permease protein
MNRHLYVLNIRQHGVVVVGITAVLMMYASIAAWMFNPESAEAINDFIGVLPEAFIKALGFDGLGTDLTTYLANYLFGFIYLMFPMLFVLFIATKLIGKPIDSGSMVYLVATPLRRTTIAITQIIFLLDALLFVFVVNFAVTYIVSELRFPGMLDVSGYFMLNLMTYLVIGLLASIVFFLSVLPIDYGKAQGIAIAFSVYAFIANALYKLSDSLSFLQYTTIFRFVNIEQALQMEASLWTSIGIISLLTFAFLVASVWVFEKRPLNI